MDKEFVKHVACKVCGGTGIDVSFGDADDSDTFELQCHACLNHAEAMSNDTAVRYDQTIMHSETTNGNCTQAVVATLLNLSLHEVPDFANTTENPSGFWGSFESFLKYRGFEVVTLPGNYVPDCDYLASGKSTRGVQHMVIMNGGSLVHDPHPSRSGLVSIDTVFLLVPKRYSNCAYSPVPRDVLMAAMTEVCGWIDANDPWPDLNEIADRYASKVQPDVELVSYAPDMTTCTLRIGEEQYLFDRHVDQPDTVNQQMLAEVLALLENHQKWINRLPVPTNGATHQMMHVIGKAIDALNGMKAENAQKRQLQESEINDEWHSHGGKVIGNGTCFVIGKWNYHKLRRAIAQTVAVPEGYVLVPVDPTDAMLHELSVGWDSCGNRTMQTNYIAMLKAAKKGAA